MWTVLIITLVLVFCLVLATWMPGTALVGSFFLGGVCFALTVFVREGQHVHVPSAILALSIFPLTVVWLKLHAVRMERPGWPYVAAAWILRIGYWLAGLALLVVVFQPFGPIFFVLFVAFSVYHIAVRRRVVVLHVLQAIVAAMRQNLPLSMALHSAVQDETSAARRPLRRIANWLDSGYPLSQALRLGYRRCPREVLACVEVGERVGRLPDMLDGLIGRFRDRLDYQKRIRLMQVNILYPAVVGMLLLLVLGGVAAFVFPVWAQVIHDMTDGARNLPPVTLWLLRVAGWMAGYGLAVALLVLLAFLLWWGWGLVTRMIGSVEPGLFDQLRDGLRWHLPIVRRLERLRSIGQACALLRSALQAGHPLTFALSATAHGGVNMCLARRLERWGALIRDGTPVAQAARLARVGRGLIWVFDESLDPTECPQRLEMVETGCRHAHDFGAVLVRSVLGPVIILLLGAVVGTVAYGFFIPMIRMIQVLAEGMPA